jgi:hypothetical protein
VWSGGNTIGVGVREGWMLVVRYIGAVRGSVSYFR